MSCTSLIRLTLVLHSCANALLLHNCTSNFLLVSQDPPTVPWGCKVLIGQLKDWLRLTEAHSGILKLAPAAFATKASEVNIFLLLGYLYDTMLSPPAALSNHRLFFGMWCFEDVTIFWRDHTARLTERSIESVVNLVLAGNGVTRMAMLAGNLHPLSFKHSCGNRIRKTTTEVPR